MLKNNLKNNTYKGICDEIEGMIDVLQHIMRDERFKKIDDEAPHKALDIESCLSEASHIVDRVAYTYYMPSTL